jgi:hypothetical protein
MSVKRSFGPEKARGARPTATTAKAATMKRLASMGEPVLFFLFLAGWFLSPSSDGAEIAMEAATKKASG